MGTSWRLTFFICFFATSSVFSNGFQNLLRVFFQSVFPSSISSSWFSIPAVNSVFKISGNEATKSSQNQEQSTQSQGQSDQPSPTSLESNPTQQPPTRDAAPAESTPSRGETSQSTPGAAFGLNFSVSNTIRQFHAERSPELISRLIREAIQSRETARRQALRDGENPTDFANDSFIMFIERISKRYPSTSFEMF